jgi:2',3'-cyclic-nucleotide 2'-phosphodiesterase (5'-nucleotidase family)
VARRATIIQQVREKTDNVLLLDGGDFLPRSGNEAQERTARFLVDIFGSFGRTIVGVGEYDLSFGTEFLSKQARDLGLIPVSANLVRPGGGETVFDPYTVETVGGVEVGVVSVIGDNIRLFLPASEEAEVEVADPVEAAAGAVSALKDRVDLVVLLAHLDRVAAQRLAEAVPGIDLMILGHTPGPFTTHKPLIFGDVPAFMIANQGRYLGELEVQVGSDGGVDSSSLVVHTLDDKVPYDEDVLEKVREFQEAENALRKEQLAEAQVRRAEETGQVREEFLGTGTCARCHMDAYRVYSESAHARAFETLIERDRAHAPECASCHVTGFGEPGGYQDDGGRNLELDLTAVQCEACHDRGTLHDRTGDYLASARESCVQCHTPEQTPDFDYDRYWSLIAH